jgi:hypothetical protein
MPCSSSASVGLLVDRSATRIRRSASPGQDLELLGALLFVEPFRSLVAAITGVEVGVESVASRALRPCTPL